MKTIIKSALAASAQHVAYWLAVFQLRALETNLSGQCDLLPSVVCPETRADMVLSIKSLSRSVVEARNRANALRPVRRPQSWRTAA